MRYLVCNPRLATRDCVQFNPGVLHSVNHFSNMGYQMEGKLNGYTGNFCIRRLLYCNLCYCLLRSEENNRLYYLFYFSHAFASSFSEDEFLSFEDTLRVVLEFHSHSTSVTCFHVFVIHIFKNYGF